MENKKEAIDLLSTLIVNGQAKIPDVANELGFGDRLRNADDEKNAETVKALNAKLGDKPLERLDAILAENKTNQTAAVENAVAAAVGPKLMKNATGQDVENPAFAYAFSKCKDFAGDALKNGIEELKKDPVMVALNAQRADGESGINRVVNGGTKPAAGGAIPPLEV